MASSDVQTVGGAADTAKVAFAALLAVAGFVAYFMLSAQGAVAQWGGLIAGLVLGVVVFFTAHTGRVFWGFLRDAKREMSKVVWPARRESMQMTLYVFGFVFIMALFLWLTDKTLEWLLYDLVLGWRK
ncbi:MAG: preprotein translocase subunit SecE [Burkholderiaceae bacterium]|jgi:preprotein translocase subunit SecE|nr:preprotein translocase subunit SecE [Burkholderiaceae bacterium]